MITALQANTNVINFLEENMPLVDSYMNKAEALIEQRSRDGYKDCELVLEDKAKNPLIADTIEYKLSQLNFKVEQDIDVVDLDDVVNSLIISW